MNDWCDLFHHYVACNLLYYHRSYSFRRVLRFLNPPAALLRSFVPSRSISFRPPFHYIRKVEKTNTPKTGYNMVQKNSLCSNHHRQIIIVDSSPAFYIPAGIYNNQAATPTAPANKAPPATRTDSAAEEGLAEVVAVGAAEPEPEAEELEPEAEGALVVLSWAETPVPLTQACMIRIGASVKVMSAHCGYRISPYPSSSPHLSNCAPPHPLPTATTYVVQSTTTVTSLHNLNSRIIPILDSQIPRNSQFIPAKSSQSNL
jgi:hypothetical protein